MNRPQRLARSAGVLYLAIVAPCTYVVDSTVFLIVPTATHLLTDATRFVGAWGEGVMIVWLLVRGTRDRVLQHPRGPQPEPGADQHNPRQDREAGDQGHQRDQCDRSPEDQ